MSGELVKLLSDLKEPEALAFVEKALGEGVDPMDLLGEAKEAMNIVGQRFASDEYFIPDLVFSGVILKRIVEMLEPRLKKGQEEERLGKVVIGTVAGDIHDIGKDLVVFMLDVNGFEVLDLGIDVPVQKFVDTIKETGTTVVGLSGFLTLAMKAGLNAAIVDPLDKKLMGTLKATAVLLAQDPWCQAYTSAFREGKLET